MVIQFNLEFSSQFGQLVFITGNIPTSYDNQSDHLHPLSYVDENNWQCEIEIGDNIKEIIYQYIIKNPDGTFIYDADKDKSINAGKNGPFITYDIWNDASQIENVFFTKPFTQIFSQPQKKTPYFREPKNLTHFFKIKAPLLQPNECVCITGSGKFFKEWNVKKLIPLQQNNNWHTVGLNLGKDDFPVEYKYGIYNTKQKRFVFEEGPDRKVKNNISKTSLTIHHDGLINFTKRWRGAGIAVPVFSLRTSNGFGTGEFADINLLVDWAKGAGIKMLQLLPVNDTISTHTNKDSYPYAAISAFALHPLYINLNKVANTKNVSVVKALLKKKKQLNALPHVDYEQVMKFKLSALRELYALQKDFLNGDDYIDFFKNNSSWLVPYAAFSFLRDKNGTADFTKWRYNKKFDSTAIKRLSAPAQKEFDAIAFYYFVQYHLHLQLKEVKSYAVKNGVAIKGDIPIGVAPHSCDVWVSPSLFNTNEQAGAPPDDFAISGQNWGFPTYNWENMQQDDFKWWSSRLNKMEEYFDVFRIDHILGFFRIWSIPSHAVQGILGRFIPAIPIHPDELNKNKIWFDKERYCHPFISDEILQNQFGDKSKYVVENFLIIKGFGYYSLREQFNTQQKVENYFKYEPDAEHFKNGLFNLISNVIFIVEEENKFHFRIDMQKATSFQNLDPYTQSQLNELYVDYFYHRQNVLWKKEAMQKLPSLKNKTDMLICGEDLGMVPQGVEEVMQNISLLSLEVQRMPKKEGDEFSHLKNAAYLSVITPSTHDMSTLRMWWKEDKESVQRFFNIALGQVGNAPEECEDWIIKEIILQHLNSPAMWSVFQLQDIFAMDKSLTRKNLDEERINIPADANHSWNYRMHITLEELIRHKDFNNNLKKYIVQSGRA